MIHLRRRIDILAPTDILLSGVQALTNSTHPHRPPLLLPANPALGNWMGLFVFFAVALVCAFCARWKGAAILAGLGLASFLTPVTYWVFAPSTGKLNCKSCNAIWTFRAAEFCSLTNIVSVVLKVTSDGEGGSEHCVYLQLASGRRVNVSTHRPDAERVANFLGLEVKMTEV